MPEAPTSRMRAEALEAPARVAELLAYDGERYAELGAALRAQPPRGVVTLARGSSDHAAQHLAYLVMARLGQLVTSLPLSLMTLYGSPLHTQGLLALALSQSGRSPDLVDSLRALRAGGARTVAWVNDAASPLAGSAGLLLPLHAGPETSVAATKSVIAQLVAGARLVAAWQDDAPLAGALSALADDLHEAASLDWSAPLEQLATAQQLYVIGRGPGLAVAQEAALKFKEVCGMQAEPFSGAELAHGPMALVQPGWPVLVLAPRGPAQPGLLALARRLHDQGAAVLLSAPAETSGLDGIAVLPARVTGHADLDAIAMLQSLYPALEHLARRRGRDPDHPPGLAKVTLTR